MRGYERDRKRFLVKGCLVWFLFWVIVMLVLIWGTRPVQAASLYQCVEVLGTPFNQYTYREEFKIEHNIPLDMGTKDFLCWAFEQREELPTPDTCIYWEVDEVLINDPVYGEAGVYFACWEYGIRLPVLRTS